MTVTTLIPSSATAGLSASQLPLANANIQASPYPVNGAVGAASAGVAERPGIGTRLLNAMRAAISELRGTSTVQAQAAPLTTLPAGQAIVPSPRGTSAQPAGMQTLAATAREVAPIGSGSAMTGPVAATPVRHLHASSLSAAQKAAVKARVAAQAKNDKVAAAQAGTAGAIGAVGATGAVGAPGAVGPVGSMGAANGIGPAGALPANATQLPNATVYSYDQSGNPAMAGLAGLPASTQQQLGILGQYGMPGNTGAQTTPQMNQTNQTSVPTSARGVLGNAGTSVPTLGAAIYNPPVTPAATSAAAQPASGSGNAGTQSVANRNSNDQSAVDQGAGAGYGINGMALPYGSSMTGQSGISGFFSRLFR